jgi:3-oxoadipate enol-lactonase
MSLTKVNEIMINYEIRGAGPRLLFIHGIGADLKNPISIFNTKIVDHFTVMAFDPRGLGESSKPDQPFFMADMAEDAAGLAEALGWEKYNVIGASMGGMVAQELAIRFPQVINKIVLASTHAGGECGAPLIIDKLDQMTTLEKMYTSDTRQDQVWAEANPDLVTQFEQQSQLMMEAFSANPGMFKGYRQQVEAVLDHDTYDRLHLIKAPTFITCGRYDGSIPPVVSGRMAERIPDSRLQLTEHGHGSWYHDPEVWASIIRFLKE